MRFLDANIILRYLTNDDSAKAAACFALLQAVKEGREQLQTTESIVAEAVYVLSSSRQPYRLSRADIVLSLLPIVRLRGLHVPRKKVVLRALDIYQVYSHLDFEDALSVASMEQSNVREIVSYDTDFDRVAAITRQEP